MPISAALFVAGLLPPLFHRNTDAVPGRGRSMGLRPQIQVAPSLSRCFHSISNVFVFLTSQQDIEQIPHDQDPYPDNPGECSDQADLENLP